jgi:hypothetical protein
MYYSAALRLAAFASAFQGFHPWLNYFAPLVLFIAPVLKSKDLVMP